VETAEHETIKETICKKLREWFGASLSEYPSSGHELDVFAVTPDGISIGVEIIWTPTENNFLRCLNLIQQSDARVKIVIANPKIISNPKYLREFAKVAIAQRKKGVLIHGELVDGRKILEDPKFVETEVKSITYDLVQKVSYEHVEKAVEVSLPEIPKPDEVKEYLIPNLFPVVSYPSKIFSAPTSVRTEPEVFRVLGNEVSAYPFILKNKRIYTFHDLRDTSSPFRPIISVEDITEENVAEWLKDGQKRNDLIRLLNLALRIYCMKRNMYYDKKHKRYFCLLREDGKDYTFTWRVRGKRVIAKKHHDRRGNLLYCMHYAASLRFMFLNNQLFSKIEPTITFTSDGRQPLHSNRIMSLLSKRLPKQFNDTYLKLVMFWAKYLSRLDVILSIPAGEQTVEIRTVPIEIPISVGIAKEDSRNDV